MPLRLFESEFEIEGIASVSFLAGNAPRDRIWIDIGMHLPEDNKP